MTVSMETVRMAKSSPRKNQSERSDLPSLIIRVNKGLYYMASFVSEQYEPNPNFFGGVFKDLDSVSVHKNAKTELFYYPGILTSHFVTNLHKLLR